MICWLFSASMIVLSTLKSITSMQKTTVKKIKTWLKIAVVVYIVCGTALYFFQEKILFHPLKLTGTSSVSIFQLPSKKSILR